jgi:hypothetical protein
VLFGVVLFCAIATAGHDISHGMRPIYNIMGFCPQHDLLWTTLSGKEHLRFYGTLKGMSGECMGPPGLQQQRYISVAMYCARTAIGWGFVGDKLCFLRHGLVPQVHRCACATQ